MHGLVGCDLMDLIRLFIALSKLLFIRMIGAAMGRRNWLMRAEHPAQYAALLAGRPSAPYRMHLTALPRSLTPMKENKKWRMTIAPR
jgi:hypothetical protein